MSTDLGAVPAGPAGEPDADADADATAVPPTTGAPRRLAVATSAVAAVVWLLFVVVLTYGRLDVVHPETFGNFYDAQARALLDGRIAVDPDQVGFEGFRVGDRTHIYQGLVPALARVPVLAVTDRLDGRLTALSMSVGMAVALGHLVLLAVVARRLVRGDDPVGRAEVVAVAATVGALGASPLLFLSAKAWVYHEALLWGAALTIASLAHLLRWAERVRADDRAGSGPLAWSGLFAVLAVNSRFSTGLGALAALGLVGSVVLLGRWAARGRPEVAGRIARWSGIPVPLGAGRALGVLVATAVLALGSYAVVNHARFGTLFGLPIERQGVASSDPQFRAALAANGGSLFGLKYTPSVLTQLLRPDALGVRGEFPFVGFPSARPADLNDAVFAERDRSTSLPTSAPLVLGLAVVGLVAMARPRHWSRDGGAAAARLPVIGSTVSMAGIAVLGYIANRYQVDLLPGLAVAAVVGVAGLSRRWAGAPVARRALAGVAVAGALWGAWVNTGVALQYQREIAAGAWDGSRAAWLGLQTRLGPVPEVVRVPVTSPLPPAGPLGRVAVVGRCDAVYRSDSEIWLFLSGGAAAGSYRLRVRATGELTGPVPLLEGVGPEGSNRLVVEPHGPPGVAHLQVEVREGGTLRKAFPGPPFPWRPGSELDLRTEMDWRTDTVEIRDAADRRLLGAVVRQVPTGDVRPAGGPGVAVSGSARRAVGCSRLLGD